MMTSVEVVLEDFDVMVYIGINDGTLIKVTAKSKTVNTNGIESVEKLPEFVSRKPMKS